MSSFVYKARDSSGKLVEGELEETSEQAAYQYLIDKGYTPIEIEPKGVLFSLPSTLFSFQHIRLRELSVLFRQLSTIFSAGVPLFESLIAIEEQISNMDLKKIVGTLRRDVEGGDTFSQSLAKHPGIFSGLIVTMVEAGERGGVLGEVLSRISAYLEKEEDMQYKIKGALRYPIMVLSVLAVAFFGGITFIIPKFNSIFSAFKRDLPLPTRILLAINFVLMNYWFLMIVVCSALYFSFKFYTRLPMGRKQLDTFLLKIPVLGMLITKISLSRFFRMLSSMISSGIPLVSSLEVTANTADNVLISQAILDIREQVIGGSGLSIAVGNSKLFPASAVHMIAIGEKSGNLEVMLEKTADYFEEETDFTISNLTPLLEPFLILILACMVLLLALGIFLPMWSIMDLYQ